MSNWYLQNGKESDIVYSSRIRLSRNISQIPFSNKCKKEDFKKIYDKMEEVSHTLGYGLKFMDMENIDVITRESLVEKHIISPEFANCTNPYTALIVNDEQNISIMINGEDHIKIQVFSSGLDLENLLSLAIEIDEKIEDTVQYSYHKKYGYLTACPTNVGTALKASVMVHLPALSITGNLSKVSHIVNNFGMSIRGIYGENSKSIGDFYQISNNQTLGITEKDIIKNLKVIADKLIEQERSARKYLARNFVDLEDKLYRSFGIFKYAKKLGEDETFQLLSEIKLGTDLGIINQLDDQKIRKLIIDTKPAQIQIKMGKKLDGVGIKKARCEIISQILEK